MAEKWVSPNQQRRLARIPEDKREQLSSGIASLGLTAAEFTPGLGDAMTAQEAYGEAQEGNYGTAALLAALAAMGLIPGVGDAVAGAGRTALRQADMLRRPKVDNTVVYPQLKNPETLTALDYMLERPMFSADQATHAQRSMTNAELYDMYSRGFMLPAEGGSAFASRESPKKWFSPADEAGAVFGRPWVGRGGQRVRVPMSQLPPKRAVRSRETEVYDAARGRYVPFNEFIEDFLRVGPPDLTQQGFGAGAARRRKQ